MKTPSPRRGSAMPMVLFGMALAIGIATLAWTRSWTRRTTSSHADLAWQSQLLAESATACALQEALARASSQATKDTTAKDTARKKIVTIRDTVDTACGFHGPAPGTMSWEQPAGTQLLAVRARGSVLESGQPLETEMRSIWGGNPPIDRFVPAISLWGTQASSLQLSGTVQGSVRVRFSPPPPGTRNHTTGQISDFVPNSVATDTGVAIARMDNALRSEDGKIGGETFSPARPPPDQDSIVHTFKGAITIFDGPYAGDPWDVGRARTLFTDGRVEIRGKVRMDGWTIFAKGQVVVQDDAELKDVSVFAGEGVRIADRARLSGQILSGGTISLSEDSRLAAPTFAACWPTKGRDSVPRILLSNQSQAEAYLVALGANAEVSIARGARLRGVAVSGGMLRNDGRIEGVAVSVRLDCGRGADNCSGGTFLRDRLPEDFAFPLGLPGNRGFRLVSWRTGP